MTWVEPMSVAWFLNSSHYLGATNRGKAWQDSHGVIVFAKPTSRRLPQDGTWVELVRWCLLGHKNGGSMQWAVVRRELPSQFPGVTTVISYSDPSAGHTGALYRACNWKWVPTWQRLRPPPSGNGSWKDGQVQAVKDRWVFEVGRDDRREQLLCVRDESLVRRGIPTYREFMMRQT